MAKQLKPYRNAALPAEQAVKTTAGKVYWINVYNPNASIVFLNFYDRTTGQTTPGTTAPDYAFAIPASGSIQIGPFDRPIHEHATAITIAGVTTATGGTAPTTPLVVHIGYT